MIFQLIDHQVDIQLPRSLVFDAKAEQRVFLPSFVSF
jgi:hypothetical protein